MKSPGGENYSLVVPPEKATSLALQGWISGEASTRLFASAGQDLAKDRAEAEDIRSAVDIRDVAVRLFRRHVGHRAHHHAGLSQAG